MKAVGHCLLIMMLAFASGHGAAFAAEGQAYDYDALGRLAAVRYSGDINNGQAHSLCYDAAGNRTGYQSSAAGVLANCSTIGSGGGGGAGNKPPVANPDSIGVRKCVGDYKNVIANDTDPEDNYPLTLTSVDVDWAYVYDSNTVGIVISPSVNGSYPVHYTVQDSLGASATGILTVTVSGNQQCL